MRTVVYGIAAVALVAFTIAVFTPILLNTDMQSHSRNLSPKYLAAGKSVVTLDSSLPDARETMMAYTVDNGVSLEEAQKTARKLGFTGSVEKKYGDYIVTSNPTEFSVDSISGSLYYSNESAGERPGPDDTLESLPDDDTAVKIAREFLLSKNLWEEDAEYTGVTYCPSMEFRSSNGTLIATTGLKGIEFTRKINDFTIFGDVIDVDVGAKEDIVRIFKHWRKIKPYKPVKLIKPDTAYQQFSERAAQKTGVSDMYIAITNVELGYYSLPPVMKQKYLKPVYAFEGIITGNNCSEPYIDYVAAAPELGDLE